MVKKNTSSASILLVLFTFWVNPAFAESNPLLTIFEGIKIGISVEEVLEAVDAFNGRAKAPYSNRNKVIFTALDSEGIKHWVWYDPTYLRPFGGRSEPASELFVDINDAGKIIKARYKYRFLYLERTSTKP